MSFSQTSLLDSPNNNNNNANANAKNNNNDNVTTNALQMVRSTMLLFSRCDVFFSHYVVSICDVVEQIATFSRKFAQLLIHVSCFF